ncbi:MAG: rubrerythrin family protein [Firmicutes bacterium HGW-Firmicutes-7]|nr:MAG: rubrerythrin family protein [Firmicutes bacterium HGW-Firmicutes-7]
MQKVDPELIKMLLVEQKNEITGHLIYKRLASKTKNTHNAKVLHDISEDELGHYNQFKSITGEDVKPNMIKVYFFYLISIFFGLTFGVKLLEKTEIEGQQVYSKYQGQLPLLTTVLEEEEKHEKELIDMLNEEKLNYIGSIVLGLNDALVELTGALAGYTFAFQDTKIIALTGLITGISASFSMAASEYLSTKQEEGGARARKAAIYTGIAYVCTVALLITPFLFLKNPFISLLVTLTVAVLIILVFNYYVSVAKDLDFKKRFLEMVVISLGVSAISFVIGILVKQVFNIEI